MDNNKGNNKGKIYNIQHIGARELTVDNPGMTPEDEAALVRIYDRADVSEKALESYLVRRAKEHGLLCVKYAGTQAAGYPDRLLLLPEGRVVWVELKSRGEHMRHLQRIRAAQLAAMGHMVACCDSRDKINDLLNLVTDSQC